MRTSGHKPASLPPHCAVKGFQATKKNSCLSSQQCKSSLVDILLSALMVATFLFCEYLPVFVSIQAGVTSRGVWWSAGESVTKIATGTSQSTVRTDHQQQHIAVWHRRREERSKSREVRPYLCCRALMLAAGLRWNRSQTIAQSYLFQSNHSSQDFGGLMSM